MPTREELIIEAARLDQLGRQYWAEARQRGTPNDSDRIPQVARDVLYRFPDTTIMVRQSPNYVGTETRRMSRRIEVLLRPERPEFRLVEEEFGAEPGEGVESLGVVPLVQSDDVFGVLSEGYRMVDEDRLAEVLAPIAERIEDTELCESTPETIREVENLIMEDREYSIAARMRVRAEIVAFLDGRLEPGQFIARTVERQRCFERSAENYSEEYTERIEIE